MTQALTIVVAAVVLIVVSLVVITIVTGVLGKWGGSQSQQVIDTSNKASLATVMAYCKSECVMGNKGASTDLKVLNYDGSTESFMVTCNAALSGTSTGGTKYAYTIPPECV